MTFYDDWLGMWDKATEEKNPSNQPCNLGCQSEFETSLWSETKLNAPVSGAVVAICFRMAGIKLRGSTPVFTRTTKCICFQAS